MTRTLWLKCIVALIAALACWLASLAQPQPGRGGLLMSLGPDWSLACGDTDYEIGNSLEHPNSLELYRWKPVQHNGAPVGYAMEVVVDNIRSAAFDGNLAVLNVEDHIVVVNMATGEVTTPETCADRDTATIQTLATTATVPQPSHRHQLAALAVVFALAGVVCGGWALVTSSRPGNLR